MRRRDKGWPMPPPAPRTATFDWRAAEDENWRDWALRARAAARENMAGVVVAVGGVGGGVDDVGGEKGEGGRE